MPAAKEKKGTQRQHKYMCSLQRPG